tara:strand:- start:1105 stop:1209 length:105 start_codon:yes stop_codon:yes gene_type:complete
MPLGGSMLAEQAANNKKCGIPRNSFILNLFSQYN